MPKFTNLCPITYEPISKEESYLVKVPKTIATADQKAKNIIPQDTYYYIENLATLEKLESCPFTRRNGQYFVIKLAELTDEEMRLLEEEKDNNTLIDDKNQFSQIEQQLSLKWKERNFTPEPSNQPITSEEDVLLIHNQINGMQNTVDGVQTIIHHAWTNPAWSWENAAIHDPWSSNPPNTSSLLNMFGTFSSQQASPLELAESVEELGEILNSLQPASIQIQPLD